LNVARSCTNVARFGAITPKKCLAHFCTYMKKIAKMNTSGPLSHNVLD